MVKNEGASLFMVNFEKSLTAFKLKTKNGKQIIEALLVTERRKANIFGAKAER